MAMRRISVIILLSLVETVRAEDRVDTLFDSFAHKLSNKLVDRALQAWSGDHGGLDDATCEKPGARTATKLGAVSSDCKSGTVSDFISRFRSPFLRAIERASKPAEPEYGSIAQTADHVESAGIHVPTLLPVIPISVSQNGGGPTGEGLEYIARLAAIPGVLPGKIHPTEAAVAASVHMAGKTPVETPAETPVGTPNKTPMDTPRAWGLTHPGYLPGDGEAKEEEKTQLSDSNHGSDNIIIDHNTPRNDLKKYFSDHKQDDIWWLENGEPLYIGDTPKDEEPLPEPETPHFPEPETPQYAASEFVPPVSPGKWKTQVMDSHPAIGNIIASLPGNDLKKHLPDHELIDWSDAEGDANSRSPSSRTLSDDIRSEHHPPKYPHYPNHPHHPVRSDQHPPLVDPLQNVDPQERKIDPEDGQAYSFHDLHEWYKGIYSDNQIKAYWNNECKQIEKTPSLVR